MPQAIQPGSYLTMYGQKLQQSAQTIALQQAASPTLGQLQGITNPLAMVQTDTMIANSMAGIDSMLSTVGVGISGTPDPGQQPVNPFAGPATPGITSAGLTATPALTPTNIFAGAPVAAAPIVNAGGQNISQPSMMQGMPMAAQMLMTLFNALSRLMPPSA